MAAEVGVNPGRGELLVQQGQERPFAWMQLKQVSLDLEVTA